MIGSEKKQMLIYVCSPLSASTRAEMLRNAAKAIVYMSKAEYEFGGRAVAPHAYLPYLLDDTVPEQRELALDFGRKLLAMCSKMVVFGDHISNGMQGEIDQAIKQRIPILYRTDLEGRCV